METVEEIIKDTDNKIISVSFNYAKSIFNNINPSIFKNLIFTEDSVYSSSKIKGSFKLIDVIMKTTNNDMNIIITDGTANIGTDTIHLAEIFKTINAIEYSKINFTALKNNTELLCKNNNIKCYYGDTNGIIENLEQDIIYIDAPWGGRSYKKFDKIKLYLGDVEILDFYLKNKNRSKFFIFKVPYNYDFDYLRQYIVNKITIYAFKKESIIKYFLLVIENDIKYLNDYRINN